MNDAIRSRIAVLLEGETGSGKTFLAQWIHELSPCGGGPFVPVNCGNLAGSMLEAELFGHEQGAYTDARQSRPGLIETAAGGTLFLDEIAELGPSDQARLLTVLERGSVRRLGGTTPIPVDFRLICATNRDINALVETGAMRRDLFHRMAELRIRLRPLRERRGRIPRLIPRLLDVIDPRRIGVRRTTYWRVNEDAVEALSSNAWPGNIRELLYVLERALMRSEGAPVTAEHITAVLQELQSPPADEPGRRRATASTGPRTRYARPSDAVDERSRITETLRRTKGNKRRAACELGMSRSTLYTSIKGYRIEEQEWKP